MAGGRPAAGLGVERVQAMLGPDRPPRHQQPQPARTGHRIRMDDPQVDPGDPDRTWPAGYGTTRSNRSHNAAAPAAVGSRGRHRSGVNVP
jgi:hypothetical protein